MIHCPYCHGWEVRDQRIVVISSGPDGSPSGAALPAVVADITLCVHTGPQPTALQREELTSRSIDVVEGEVASIVVEDDRLVGVALGDGRVVPADAVVVGPRMIARSGVLSALGLDAVEHPMGFGTQIPCDEMGATEIPGVWVAGNVADIRAQVVHAAGAGTFAGAAINADLIAEDTAGRGGDARAARRAPAGVRQEVLGRAVRVGVGDLEWQPEPTARHRHRRPPAGSALDIGAGEGADALWLAQRGWNVTAVDISTVALERASERTTAEDAEAAARITWQQADVTEWAPPAGSFDLVSSQFMHLPSAQRGPTSGAVRRP